MFNRQPTLPLVDAPSHVPPSRPSFKSAPVQHDHLLFRHICGLCTESLKYRYISNIFLMSLMLSFRFENTIFKSLYV